MKWPYKIERVIHRYLRPNRTKLSIGIVYQGKTYFSNFGGADENSLYDIGSISKVFTSLLVLNEIEKGKLGLEDNIKQYLSLQEGYYWAIGELLTHQTGFCHVTPWTIVVPSLLTGRYSTKNLYRNRSAKDVIKEANKRRKKRNKSKFGYSDFAYALLALAMENANKGSFRDLMDAFLKNELGLDNTQCNDRNSIRVDSYWGKRKVKPWLWEDDNPYVASGGISSSLKDMCQFMSFALENKDTGYIAKSFEFPKGERKHNLSYFLNKRKTVAWHVGGVGTFRSSICMNPKRNIGIITLGNQIGRRAGNVHYLNKMIYTFLRRHKLVLG